MCCSTNQSREHIWELFIRQLNQPQNNITWFYPVNQDQRPVPTLRLENSPLWQRRMQARAQANNQEEIQS